MAISKTKNRQIYDSANREHPAIEELKSLIQYKDLILQLVRRDLVSRYKRSFLGFAWTMLNPLGTMLVMAIVFSQVFNQVKTYPVYLLSGLIIYNFFSQSTTYCMKSILWGSNLSEQIYMPRTAFIISAIGSSTVNLFLSIIPLMAIMLVLKVPIPATIFLIPIPIILVALFSLGVGLILASYSIFFPDIAEMYPVFLRALIYMSPVIVPEDRLAAILDGWVLKINPLYYLIKIFRQLIVEGTIPSIRIFGISIFFTLLFLVFGLLIFTARSDKFAYYG